MSKEQAQTPKDRDETSQELSDALLEQVTGGAISTPNGGITGSDPLPGDEPLGFGGDDWGRKKR